MLPPSERQKYAYDNCVENIGDAQQRCANVKTWNATAPTPCQGTLVAFVDLLTMTCITPPGYDGTFGICDPIDHNCYAVQDIYTARKAYRQFVQTFITSPNINNFHALDRFVL